MKLLAGAVNAAQVLVSCVSTSETGTMRIEKLVEVANSVGVRVLSFPMNGQSVYTVAMCLPIFR